MLVAAMTALLIGCASGSGATTPTPTAIEAPGTPTAASATSTPAVTAAPTQTVATGAIVTTTAAAATPSGIATPPPEPVASTAVIARSALPIAEFSKTDGYSIRLPVEVPPRSEYTIGLSGRRTLEERGMLFYFPETGRGAFWMKDTHVDLSIAFVTTDERIVEIREMQAESTALITPAADYRYAIEAPAGWYAANKVRAGDTARLNFPLPKEFTGQ